MSAGKYFLDTNIFIYSFDDKSPAKRKKAIALIRQALVDQRGAVSYQVIQEFLAAATRLFPKVFVYNDMNDYMDTVLLPLCIVYPDMDLYKTALRIQQGFRISFYDALILASASKCGCKELYSEDLNNGQLIAGVKIKNPFV